MQHHVAEDFLCILVVVAQLGAAVIMGISHDGIHALSARFAAQAFGKLVDDSVHAAHCRNNPYLVAHTYVAVLTFVPSKGQVWRAGIEV